MATPKPTLLMMSLHQNKVKITFISVPLGFIRPTFHAVKIPMIRFVDTMEI
jgi:hypothetical protein